MRASEKFVKKEKLSVPASVLKLRQARLGKLEVGFVPSSNEAFRLIDRTNVYDVYKFDAAARVTP